jgi:hypothetical protein
MVTVTRVSVPSGCGSRGCIQSNLRVAGAACQMRAGDRVANHAAWTYPVPDPGFETIKDYIAFSGHFPDPFNSTSRTWVSPVPSYSLAWISASCHVAWPVAAGRSVVLPSVDVNLVLPVPAML